MKYVKTGKFTTQQMSIDETITELEDVIAIAKNILSLPDVPQDVRKNIASALIYLKEAESYTPYIREKVKIAMEYVPEDVQQQQYL